VEEMEIKKEAKNMKEKLLLYGFGEYEIASFLNKELNEEVKKAIENSKVSEVAKEEIKIKESKINDKNTMCKAEALALFERLWILYPNKKGKGQVSDSAKLKLSQIGYDEMVRAIDRYKAELEKDKDWRKPQNGSTFFNSGYIDYLDTNYVPAEVSIKGKNKPAFNNFPQRSYDYDAMEKLLLERK